MLQDVHSRKISIPVTAPVGDTTVIAAVSGAWIYVHELIGDLAANGTLDVKAGTRTLASFTLDMGQGLTLQDEPGEDNRPRFECLPGEAFILTVTGGTFNGACHYSLRY
jgi:hypothetical protein